MSQAAKAVGRSRAPLNGILRRAGCRSHATGTGQPYVEIAELERAYGRVEHATVSQSVAVRQDATAENVGRLSHYSGNWRSSGKSANESDRKPRRRLLICVHRLDARTRKKRRSPRQRLTACWPISGLHRRSQPGARGGRGGGREAAREQGGRHGPSRNLADQQGTGAEGRSGFAPVTIGADNEGRMDHRRLEWLGLVRPVQRPHARSADLRRAARLRVGSL